MICVADRIKKWRNVLKTRTLPQLLIIGICGTSSCTQPTRGQPNEPTCPTQDIELQSECGDKSNKDISCSAAKDIACVEKESCPIDCDADFERSQILVCEKEDGASESRVAEDVDIANGSEPAWQKLGILCLDAQLPPEDGCDCENNFDACGVPETDGPVFHGAVAQWLAQGPLPEAILAYVYWFDEYSPYCKCHQTRGVRLYLIDIETFEVCLVSRDAEASWLDAKAVPWDMLGIGATEEWALLFDGDGSPGYTPLSPKLEVGYFGKSACEAEPSVLKEFLFRLKLKGGAPLIPIPLPL